MAPLRDADIPEAHRGDSVFVALRTVWGGQEAVSALHGTVHTLPSDERIRYLIATDVGEGVRGEFLFTIRGLSPESVRILNTALGQMLNQIGLTRERALQLLSSPGN